MSLRTLAEIREFPTTVSGTLIHESCTRSYQALEKAKELLAKGCPADIILEILEDIRQAPSKREGFPA